MTLFLIVLLVALVFEYINGFHDTANAIATTISTKVLTPRQAIVLSTVFNLLGALTGTAVATTIGQGLVDTHYVSATTLLAALLAAIAWNLLTWWLEHGGEVAAAQVLALEWDVYCNTDLRTVIRPPAWQSGLAAARILSGVSERRKYRFFEEAERLPASMRALAVAAAPLAVLRVSRTALDACLAPEYADVFREDIFCEMRLPTVIRHAGFHVAELGLRHVDATPKRPAGIGIFHPVKEVAA